MFRQASRYLALMALPAALLVAGCRHEPPVARSIVRPAQVQRIEIVVLDSVPVQVRVVAHGYLPDGCTAVAGVEQRRDGNAFHATVSTTRPAGALCTQQIIPFRETFPLDVAGLPAGSYTVEVNGQSGSFTLTEDVPQ